MRICFALLVMSMFMLNGAVAQGDTCPEGPATALSVGGTVEVPPGSPNNLRRVASRSADRLGQIESGDVVTVTDGPTCAEGFAWWQVDADGISAWTPEGIIDAEGVFSEYYLYREGALVLADDFEYSIDVDAVADSTTQRFGVASIKRVDTYFSAYSSAVFNYYLEAYPTERASLIEQQRNAILFFEPLDFYDPYVPAYWEEAQELRALLSDQPSDVDFIPAPAKTFDEVLSQMFAAQVAYLEFGNGMGVRFVTEYSYAPEDESSITWLTYDFQAITDDGRYYVNGNFPVYVESLDLEFDGGDYDAYLVSVAEQLNQLTADDFVPSLNELDAVLKSLEVTGSDQQTTLALQDE